MTLALSSQKLKQWIGNAIEAFRSQDLIGISQPWLDIYEALANYICSEQEPDQTLLWMIQNTDDSLPDVVYQLQRLNQALLEELIKDSAHSELLAMNAWFNNFILNLIERSGGKLSETRTLSIPYETVFWKAREAMYISTVKGHFLHVNQAMLKLLKYKNQKQVQEVNISSDLYLDKDKRLIMLNHLFKDGFFDHHELQFRCADGDVKTAIESCYLVNSPDGERFIVGILIDISHEKAMQQRKENYIKSIEHGRMEAHFSLRQVAQRFDSLMKVNTNPVIIVDPKDFHIGMVNPAFYTLFHYQEKHMSTINFRDLFTERDWMEIFPTISNSVQRIQYHIPNVSCKTFDGDPFPVEVSIIVHQDDMGRALFVQIEDREETLELDKQLTHEQDNNTRLIENVKTGIISFRSDGSVAYVNNYLASMMGYRDYQLKNISLITSLFAQDEFRLRLNKYIRRFLRGLHADDVFIELKARNGTIHEFLLNTMSFHHEGESAPGFLALLSEIPKVGDSSPSVSEASSQLKEFSEQRESFARIQEAYQDLQERIAFRRSFFKKLSEKFKVPIHVVLGFTSLMRKDLDGIMNNDQKEDFDIIGDHIRQILGMVEKATEFWRLEDGEIQFAPETVSVRSFLDHLFEFLMPEMLGAEVSFTPRHQVLNPNKQIRVDAHLVEAMFSHLVENAVSLTKSGAIEVNAYEDEGTLWVEVQDSGPGIPLAALNHIFEPFYRTEDGEETPGLGLGLPIAKRYAELMGYLLEIENREFNGTQCRVCLGKVTISEDKEY